MRCLRRASLFASLLVVLTAGSFAVAQEKPVAPAKGISEEEFQKLHQLKPEEAPAPKGTMVDLADGSKAYLALPEGAKAPLPALIVIHEWWGLNGHIKNWADRFAATGRAALAVDLYGGKSATDAQSAGAMMKAVDEKKALVTLLAARDFLKKDARVQAPKIASIGWCFGGKWSLQLALNAPDLDAAVMYYGSVEKDPAKLKAIKGPLLGIFGNKDKSIPPDEVNAFDKALTDAGVKHMIQRYDADHAFANPSQATRYDGKAAADAWAKVQAFLDENLPAKK